MALRINESEEDYLEAILIIGREKPFVRSVDVAGLLGYKKSSVSVAMKHLREKNHIEVTEEGFICLTDAGKEIALRVYERHTFLTAWLIYLGVSEETASDDACKIEHDISAESFDAIKKFVMKNTDIKVD